MGVMCNFSLAHHSTKDGKTMKSFPFYETMLTFEEKEKSMKMVRTRNCVQLSR